VPVLPCLVLAWELLLILLRHLLLLLPLLRQSENFQELYEAFREALKVTEEDIDTFSVSDQRHTARVAGLGHASWVCQNVARVHLKLRDRHAVTSSGANHVTNSTATPLGVPAVGMQAGSCACSSNPPAETCRHGEADAPLDLLPIALHESHSGWLLCCAALCCAVLCCTVLCCAVLCGVLQVTYRGSSEERADLLRFYQEFGGNMPRVFDWLMLSRPDVDSHRFRDTIEAAITAGVHEALAPGSGKWGAWLDKTCDGVCRHIWGQQLLACPHSHIYCTTLLAFDRQCQVAEGVHVMGHANLLLHFSPGNCWPNQCCSPLCCPCLSCLISPCR
jgi:hypothetical protein